MTYISREAAIDAIWKPEVRPNALIFDALRRACEEEVKHIPAADVVTREEFNRILSENDDMREQLAQIGKNPGDKMDDVIKLPTFEESEIRKWIDTCPAPWWEPQGKVVEIEQVKEGAE